MSLSNLNLFIILITDCKWDDNTSFTGTWELLHVMYTCIQDFACLSAQLSFKTQAMKPRRFKSAVVGSHCEDGVSVNNTVKSLSFHFNTSKITTFHFSTMDKQNTKHLVLSPPSPKKISNGWLIFTLTFHMDGPTNFFFTQL